mmetsp:Transcript_81090/g.262089  ORF Transcript_81090/g.262089 Transcript_81090/m.262089 type:complete len:208 (-) Transcript_81090:7-630(-)
MEQHHGARLRILLQSLEHAFEIEAPRLRRVVRVLLDNQAGHLEDRDVVAPGGLRDPDLVGLGAQERLRELRADAQRAGAREALHRGDAPRGNGLAVIAKGQLLGQRLEIGRPIDGAVLLVDGGARLLENLCFGFQHDVEHVRLAVFRAVGAHAQVDLPGVRVRLESQRRSQDGIRRSHRQTREKTHGCRIRWSTSAKWMLSTRDWFT